MPLWGAAEGDLIARQQGVKELSALAEIAAQQSTGALRSAQTSKLLQELEATKQVRNALGNIQAGPGSDLYWKAATAHADAGDFESAGKLADVASKLDARKASVDMREASAEKTLFESQLNQLEAAHGALRGVTSPEQKVAFDNWWAGTFGRPSPLAGRPYSPEMTDALGQMFVKQKDAIRLMQQERQQAVSEAEAADRTRSRGLRDRLAQARTDAYTERTKALAKNGGKNIPQVSLMDLDIARSVILEKEFPSLKTSDLNDESKLALDRGAEVVADAAKRIWRNNKALTPRQATERAFQESRQAGDWTFTKRDVQSWQFRNQIGFSRRSAKGAVATPWPTSNSGFKEGQVYAHPTKGLVKFLGGTKFQAVAPEDFEGGEPDLPEDDENE